MAETEGNLLNTKELAVLIGANERFVRRQLQLAAEAKVVEISRVPGKGRLKYADPRQVRTWLLQTGYLEAARRLPG